MYDSDGKDLGYRDDPQWWYRGPDAFRIADLDHDYPQRYFPSAEPPRIKEACDVIESTFLEFTGSKLKRIIEFGSAGGWYLKEWQDRGMNVQGIEGSRHGVAECLKRGVTAHNILLHDLRRPLNHQFALSKKMDLAIFVETAEHAEPPFAGTLISTVTQYSDLVWFSAEPPGTNQSHLHHSNEQPLEYWMSIFHFFGYGCHMLPDEVMRITENRGRCLFYNKAVCKP